MKRRWRVSPWLPHPTARTTWKLASTTAAEGTSGWTVTTPPDPYLQRGRRPAVPMRRYPSTGQDLERRGRPATAWASTHRDRITRPRVG